MRVTDLGGERTYFRSGTRVFNLNGAWYFATREGNQGPFPSKADAQRQALQFANDCVSWHTLSAERANAAEKKRLRSARDVRSASPRFRSWGRLAFRPGRSAG